MLECTQQFLGLLFGVVCAYVRKRNNPSNHNVGGDDEALYEKNKEWVRKEQWLVFYGLCVCVCVVCSSYSLSCDVRNEQIVPIVNELAFLERNIQQTKSSLNFGTLVLLAIPYHFTTWDCRVRKLEEECTSNPRRAVGSQSMIIL